MRIGLLLVLLLSSVIVSIAQDQKSIIIHQKIDDIKIDGILNEASWTEHSASSPFWQYAPNDSIHAELNTDIKMTFDEKNLYISAICYANNKDYVVPSLKRDFRAGGNDNITFLIDPFNDRTNAFMFGSNPMGVQREGLISGGGANISDFSTSWDNKWKCEAQIYESYWTVEMQIPLSILRYNTDVSTWRFNAYRFDTQVNERSTWVRIPRNQWIFNLAFMGELLWEEAPKRMSQRSSIIPYINNSSAVDYEEDGIWTNKINAGGDVKFSVSSGLNLDLTANPDFSQVEVDQQITNLSRFEIFFPERRQFFQENADLFGASGNRNANPFFSRRIGISKDTVTDDNLLNPIYGGARLSGKINEKLRIGVLNMIGAPDETTSLATYNYNVFSAQYKLWKRSNIGFISVNKDAVANRSFRSQDLFNRVVGIDFNFATGNNRWTSKTYVHRSIAENPEKNPYSHGFNIQYLKRRFQLTWAHQYVGEGFDAQVGFVPRKGFIQINPRAEIYLYQTKKKLNRVTTSLQYRSLFDPSFFMTDQTIQGRLSLEFISQARFDLRVQNNFVYLLESWDPTGTESIELPGEVGYHFTNANLSFNSPRNYRLFTRINANLGQYYTGLRYGLRGFVTYQFQPIVNLSLNYSYNIFDMPYLESSRSTVVLGPRIDVSFTKKLFLTGSIQYNSQSENSNMNIRFQYRFAPVSDLFIVYTDNYFTDIDNGVSPNYIDLQSRNRAIVLKCSYWLNI